MATAVKGSSWGRSFVHPAFDILLIGGGLSLVATLFLWASPERSQWLTLGAIPYIVLLSTASHFAASTVRLYTKPGTKQSLPFLTMAFPLVALAILSLTIAFAGHLGSHLQSLYLTWSPYHYAAQAYGLAVMYAHRSGCHLNPKDKKRLRWIAMLPFAFNFLTAPMVGLNWLLPASVVDDPAFGRMATAVGWVLIGAAVVTPILLIRHVWNSYRSPLPAISILTVVANGIWFFVLAPLEAFVFATIFHGIQYMAIVIIFHVKDQLGRPGNKRGPAFHAFAFYAASLALGYALFSALPQAYIFAGFGRVESVLLVVAAINIHHFIVDAYIWKLERDQGNRRVVESGTPVAA